MASDPEEKEKASRPADQAEEKSRRRATRRTTRPHAAATESKTRSATPESTSDSHSEAANLAIQRAEELVNRLGDRVSRFMGDARTDESGAAASRVEGTMEDAGRVVGHFASDVGLRARRATARAREEVEDIWAEAQAIRRGNHS